ncbi:hypothetical protein [Salinimicrobium sediminilitoris]|uniref:hypothetical protein n=1 Tax=Salinimicrobium sediminilitoris TaxID=2876715 RepID=UPI001E5B63D8|nr:hypothetical protein [Salinimicrobium sediminilitoris]MCC8358770.1 hypothetical protein [Salinimicrobium sediminilitoris]
MKFISIMADERSGSTFAGTYAQYYGKKVFYIGELDNGLIRMVQGRNGTCSCGAKYLDCPVWGQIMLDVQKGVDLKKIIMKIQEITGAEVIVDSSKDISYHQKFRDIFGNNHSTIHIKRNPKGVILSRMKSRKRRIKKGNHPKPHIANKYNSMMIYDCITWSYRNSWMENFKIKGNNLDLTYDLLDVELPSKLLKFYKENEIEVEKKKKDDHIIMGNKFTRMGDIESDINVSHSWVNDLQLFQKVIVDVSTLPVRLWYKYKFRKTA